MNDDTLNIQRTDIEISLLQKPIDLIHDSRHLCSRIRIDEIKALSRGISGGKQVIKFANTSSKCRVCLFSQNETTI